MAKDNYLQTIKVWGWLLRLRYQEKLFVKPKMTPYMYMNYTGLVMQTYEKIMEHALLDYWILSKMSLIKLFVFPHI